MFRKLFSLMAFSFLATASFLSAEVKYDIHDIDTLQTHSSAAIALNNNGQILGWYNIDGAIDGKQVFVRDQDGTFHELPTIADQWGRVISWKYLTDNGKAYGTFYNNADKCTFLLVWDHQSGLVNLGTLPGGISAINNSGQVLIKSVSEVIDERKICYPVIWENGKLTKLKGLESDLGIEAEESYGFDMNNKGEVVGQSVAYLSYKNNIYKQIHAVKWVNGEAIDLH